MSTKPDIIMSEEAYDLFSAYVELMPGEVAVWGYVTVEHDYLYVSEVFLVPQQANSGGVDFVTEGLPYAIDKAIADGKLDQLRFCAHSHGTHKAFWSTTDESMIATLGEGGTPWLVSVIFNKEGEQEGRLDVFTDSPFGKLQHTQEGLDIYRHRPIEAERQMIADLERLVKEPPKQHKGKHKKGSATTGTVTQGTAGGAARRAATGAVLTTQMKLDLRKDGMKAEDLDNVSFLDLEILALEHDWSCIDDSEGNRWWYTDVKGNTEIVACGVIPPEYHGDDIEGSAIEISDERALGVTANS